MKNLIFGATLVCALLVSNLVGAQGRHRSQPPHRAAQGAHYGQMSHNETQKFRMQQQRVRVMKHRAMADGRVTPRERMMIRRAEHRAQMALRQQRHARNHYR